MTAILAHSLFTDRTPLVEEGKSDKSSDVEIAPKQVKLTVEHDIAEAIKVRENAFKGKSEQNITCRMTIY